MGGGAQFLDNIRREKVDIVFNISEGRGNYRSREAQVPAVLEMLDIPYTGSDPLCLAVCLDKPITKKLVAMAGIPTPKWLIIADVTGTGANGLERFSFSSYNQTSLRRFQQGHSSYFSGRKCEAGRGGSEENFRGL